MQDRRSPSAATFGLVLSLALGGCSGARLLLAPPSRPPLEGASITLRGPAYAPHGLTRGAPASSTDWGTYNKTLAGNRYSPLAQITRTNVGSLRRVCAFRLDHSVNMQSGLLAIGGTLYFTTLEDTYAVDAADCRLRWQHTYRLARRPPFDPNQVNRGLAWLDGRLFRGSNDGRLYALDAATGRELWNVAIGSPESGETFPAAPVAWNGRVYIGNAGGDYFGVTGRMMAFDAATGGRLWSADLVPTAGPANRTWPPATAEHPKAGGTTWTSYAIDERRGLLYVPTGNAAPDFIKSVRPGDNLYTYSVVALDLRTGELRSARQLVTGQDFHDWDVAAPPELIDTPGGRHLLIAAGKNGYLYALDQATLRLLYKTPVSKLRNVDAPLTPQGTHYCPGIDGGVEWNGPAYSPQTNALYVNAIDWCTTVAIRPAAQLEGRKGLPWTGAKDRLHPFGVPDEARSGWVTAVDAADGSVRWRYHARAPLVAGITATAGGVVFTGDIAGDFMAFDARSGRVLWRRNTGQPIGGGVISYAVNGKQYIAVASGMRSKIGWQVDSTPAKIVVFALP
ncbi:MAG TPA: PQQ-binding-like beta-propeller repeat protein [Steroidobacteraceae bacterium]|jgi:alcohol dehydrogenase (cytochrome c)|nr:PQQ-binding-like beta-propeller repeat protein [Steroidobacteraceae bacterium]